MTTIVPITSYDRRRVIAVHRITNDLHHLRALARVTRDVQKASIIRAGTGNFVMAMFLADRLVKAITRLCGEYDGQQAKEESHNAIGR
jgi:hypothetical protein